MQEPEYDLIKSSDEEPAPDAPARNYGVWIAGVLLVLAAAALAYYAFGGGGRPPAAVGVETEEIVAEPEGARALGGEPMPVDVPPLGESDAFVRELVRQLSTHPRVAAWLATDGLVRNFTVVVTNVSNGRTPAQHLVALRPQGAFQASDGDDGLQIDPRTYGRYDALAEAVQSVDAAGAAELYATLKPRIEEAHGELGGAPGSFDQTLERAIVLLLRTPVSDGAAELRPRGVGYGYADERLENLTGAQKQLLRMGPRNARLVQQKLRAVALELGIPADRLPAP